MTHRRAEVGLRSTWCSWLLVLLVSLAVVGPVFAALGQEERVAERILRTVTLLPEDDLPALVRLAVVLNLAPELHALLMGAPRDYLANQTVTSSIDLAPSAFQITAIDFSIVPDAAEDAWFGVAEPLEGLVFEPKGLGIFYRNVGIFLQEVHEPLEGEVGGTMRTSDGSPTQQIEDMLALIARLTAEALETWIGCRWTRQNGPPSCETRGSFCSVASSLCQLPPIASWPSTSSGLSPWAPSRPTTSGRDSR
jgi:hypothetical protein